MAASIPNAAAFAAAAEAVASTAAGAVEDDHADLAVPAAEDAFAVAGGVAEVGDTDKTGIDRWPTQPASTAAAEKIVNSSSISTDLKSRSHNKKNKVLADLFKEAVKAKQEQALRGKKAAAAAAACGSKEAATFSSEPQMALSFADPAASAPTADIPSSSSSSGGGSGVPDAVADLAEACPAVGSSNDVPAAKLPKPRSVSMCPAVQADEDQKAAKAAAAASKPLRVADILREIARQKKLKRKLQQRGASSVHAGNRGSSDGGKRSLSSEASEAMWQSSSRSGAAPSARTAADAVAAGRKLDQTQTGHAAAVTVLQSAAAAPTSGLAAAAAGCGLTAAGIPAEEEFAAPRKPGLAVSSSESRGGSQGHSSVGSRVSRSPGDSSSSSSDPLKAYGHILEAGNAPVDSQALVKLLAAELAEVLTHTHTHSSATRPCMALLIAFLSRAMVQHAGSCH
jgi:hypothetical protein